MVAKDTRIIAKFLKVAYMDINLEEDFDDIHREQMKLSCNLKPY